MSFLKLLFNLNLKFMENIFIGIDISSKILDLCVKQGDLVKHFVLENNVKNINRFFKGYCGKDAVVAMEKTGRYNWNLLEVLEGFDFQVYVLSPLHLKKSMGLVRGKNDKIDALRICNFIEKNQNETQQWKPCPVPIKKIKVLLTERTSRIKMKKQMMAQQHDYKLMKSIGLDKPLMKLNVQLIKSLQLQIQSLEKEIEKIIAQDQMLKNQQTLIKSIPGVGNVLSWMILAKTEGFTTITNPRKMACCSGVVPFDYQSGTSIRRRPGVSPFADKAMKSVLHMAAMSAIRPTNDLGVYYLRKINEGKNKMSVLNAVRNKIIHRIFAVIKNQTFYIPRLDLS